MHNKSFSHVDERWHLVVRLTIRGSLHNAISDDSAEGARNASSSNYEQMIAKATKNYNSA